MTMCKACGADLTGVVVQANGDPDSLLDFLRDIPMPKERRAQPGHPRYDKKDGFLKCPTCKREIPISPKMADNPQKYEVL